MFVGSVERALGQGVSYRLEVSVNPLVYTLKVSWREPIAGLLVGNIWNLLQVWLTKNEAVGNGVVKSSPTSMEVGVGIRRRFGTPKRAPAWE